MLSFFLFWNVSVINDKSSNSFVIRFCDFQLYFNIFQESKTLNSKLLHCFHDRIIEGKYLEINKILTVTNKRASAPF